MRTARLPMFGEPAQRGPAAGGAIAAKGFRPFFLLASIFAALVLPVWLLALAGVVRPDAYFDAAQWHAHEMVFGFAAAVVAGFLLTAASNWIAARRRKGRVSAIMHTLYLVSVWLHIVAAMTWIGGMIFLVAVLVPMLRRPERRAQAAELFGILGVRFRVALLRAVRPRAQRGARLLARSARDAPRARGCSGERARAITQARVDARAYDLRGGARDRRARRQSRTVIEASATRAGTGGALVTRSKSRRAAGVGASTNASTSDGRAAWWTSRTSTRAPTGAFAMR